jgi:hypothetical protein
LELIKIIAKMDVIKNPCDKVKELDALFAQRRVFIDCLLKKDTIRLNFQNLIIVLQNLSNFDKSNVEACLN